MYAETIPALSKMLSNLERWLDDAVEVAEARGFDPDVLLACRLAPDMFTLTRQIQAACDSAKFIAARLGGVDAPSDPDSETTLAEVRARIARTREFVASVPEAGFVESGSRELVLPFLQGGSVTGSDYTREFAMPNFYFHLSMAYAILRHNGVPLGKRAFIGSMTVKPPPAE